MARPSPRYSAWIMGETDWYRQFRESRASIVFADRKAAEEHSDRPMRVTLIVHRPTISPEVLKRRRQERIAKINKRKAQ